MRELLTYAHQGSHWGPQDMCDAVLRAYTCISQKKNQKGVLHFEKNKQALRQTSWR
jgi:hypothetical protein